METSSENKQSRVCQMLHNSGRRLHRMSANTQGRCPRHEWFPHGDIFRRQAMQGVPTALNNSNGCQLHRLSANTQCQKQKEFQCIHVTQTWQQQAQTCPKHIGDSTSYTCLKCVHMARPRDTDLTSARSWSLVPLTLPNQAFNETSLGT